MIRSTVFVWSPQNAALREQLAKPVGRHTLRKIADLMGERLIECVNVNNKPLTHIKMEMSADESGLVTITLVERPVSIARMLFYAPLIILRYWRLPVFATWPFKHVANVLGEIEQIVVDEMQF